MSSGPNPQTFTWRVFVHNLLDGKLNAKLSPNLGFDRSDIGFVQPLNEGFEPFGNSTILTYLNRNSMVKIWKVKFYLLIYIYNFHDSAIDNAMTFRNLSIHTCNTCSAIEYLNNEGKW